MKTRIKLFFRSVFLSRSVMIMNLLGLTIAFGIVVVVGFQLKYELTFDKSYSTHERIFQIDGISPLGTEDFMANLPRPIIGHLAEHCSLVESFGIVVSDVDPRGIIRPVGAGSETSFELPLFDVSESIPDIFALEIVSGDLKNFKSPHSAIVSQSAAEKLFRDRPAVGSGIRTSEDPEPIEIVAVYRDLPRNSSLGNGVLRNIGSLSRDDWGRWDFFGYYLLQPGADPAEVTARFSALYTDRYPDVHPAYPPLRLTNLHRRYFMKNNGTIHQGDRFTVLSLFGISFLILFVAIVNFINFSVSLIPLRIRQNNIRKILGEPKGVMMAQHIAGNVLTAVIAGGLALSIVYLFSVSRFTYLIDADLRWSANREVFKFFVLTVFLTGFLSGIYPAIYGSSIPPALILKGAFGLSPSGRKLRTAMIGFQYGVSILLIILAFSIRSQYRFVINNYGNIDLSHVVVATLDENMLEKREVIRRRLAEHPEIEGVTFSYGKIISSGGLGWGRSYRGREITFDVYPVSENFTSFMNIRITEGRDFQENDLHRETPGLIFNETARRRYALETGAAVGDYTILGFCEDFNFRPLHDEIGPMALVVASDHSEVIPIPNEMYVKVNDRNRDAAIRSIGEVQRAYSPEAVSFFTIQPMDRWIGNLYAKEKNTASLIFLISLLSILISVVGVFGMILFETRYKRREISVRRIMGARTNDILWMFNKKYTWITAVCFLAACPLASYFFGNWQRNFAYNSSVSPLLYFLSFSIVLAITVFTITAQVYLVVIKNPVKSLGDNS